MRSAFPSPPLLGAICAFSALALPAPPARGEEPPADDEVREAMARATAFLRSISAEGGYLWRYSKDLSLVAGEVKATPTQIWIQPPGTPSVGFAFLRAYAASGDSTHLEAAKGAAHALARGQLESGGWAYSIDFEPEAFARFYRRSDRGALDEEEAAKRNNSTTFDDDNTQSALRYLMAVVEAMDSAADERSDGVGEVEREIREALDYGLEKLLEAQYPNGAWPQRYDGSPRDPGDYPVKPATIPEDWAREQPQRHQYGHYYTFNDNTIRDCIRTLLEAYERFGRPEHLAAAERGGDFILLAQLPEPQPVWGQQYNPAMEPDWARAFEPPAACSGESVGVLHTLMDLYLATGEERYLEPIPRALAWFERSELRPGVWARYYELGTNRPIYGDRDGRVYYALSEISEERQRGYAWEREFGVKGVMARFAQLQERGREQILERRRPSPLSERARESRRRSMAEAVSEALEALDEEGRWLTRGSLSTRGMEFGDRIETNVFISRMNLLSQYLELGAAPPSESP